VEGSGYGGLI